MKVSIIIETFINIIYLVYGLKLQLMNKAIRRGLKIDTFMQGVTMLGILGFALASFVYSGFIMFYAMLLCGILGILQLSSAAIIFGLILKDVERRGLYLLSNLGFSFMIIIGHFAGPLPDLLVLPIQILAWLSVFALAWRYFCITVQDIVRANTSYIN